MKKIVYFFGDYMYIVHVPVLWHFHSDGSVLEYVKGLGVLAGLYICRKHIKDANITLRFQDNNQNVRMIVIWHKYILFLYFHSN